MLPISSLGKSMGQSRLIDSVKSLVEPEGLVSS